MNIETEARRAELPLMLPHIRRMAEWARCANTYIDQHNALPPDGSDDATREELIAAMDELGDLMQRYADSLRNFSDREPHGDWRTPRIDGPRKTEPCAVLKFPERPRPTPRSSADHLAQPSA